MRIRLSPVIFLALLTGCGGDDHADLRQFMESTGKDSTEKLEPLPSLKPADTFSYDPGASPDPFKPRNLRPARPGGGGLQPDFARPKEPLEAYPMEGLRMVGTLMKGKERQAIIRTPENTLYRVRKGDRIGQNFGVITGISDTETTVKETIQDSAGDWTDSNTSLTLQE